MARPLDVVIDPSPMQLIIYDETLPILYDSRVLSAP